MGTAEGRWDREKGVSHKDELASAGYKVVSYGLSPLPVLSRDLGEAGMVIEMVGSHAHGWSRKGCPPCTNLLAKYG